MKNAGRKGRKLGAYGRPVAGASCYVTLVPDDELRAMADAMVPTTPYEHYMTRALLDMPVEWLAMRSDLGPPDAGGVTGTGTNNQLRGDP